MPGRGTAWRVPPVTEDPGMTPGLTERHGAICAGRTTAWGCVERLRYAVPLDTETRRGTILLAQRRSATRRARRTTAWTGQGAAWRVLLDTETRRGTTLIAERRSARSVRMRTTAADAASQLRGVSRWILERGGGRHGWLSNAVRSVRGGLPRGCVSQLRGVSRWILESWRLTH